MTTRARAYPLEVYGPVPASLATGPLRPSRVRYGQGVVVENGSTERLLFPLPAGLGNPAGVAAWLRPLSAAGAQTRGIAELSGGTRPLSLRYTATQVIATDGTATAAVNLALAAGDTVFAAATIGPGGLSVYAAKLGGAAASSTVAATSATYSTVDVGLATGQSRADAALEDVRVWRTALTSGDLDALFAFGGQAGMTLDFRTALCALTSDCPSLTTALSTSGTGLLRSLSAVGPVQIERLRPDSAYTPAGALFLISGIPTGAVSVGQPLQLDTGTVLRAIAVVGAGGTDEVYAGDYIDSSVFTGAGYASSYGDTYT